MSENQNLSPPKPDIGDTVHSVVKVVLSAIPAVGGSAVELYAAIVHPPLEKRLEMWREDIAAAVRQLQETNHIEINKLLRHEEFSTMVIQATVVVLRNHHKEKREALRNAIVNAALSEQDASDLHLAFVRFVDELSPTHVSLLKVIRAREQQIAPLKSYIEIYDLLSEEVLGKVSTDVFKMLCLELEARGLIRISSGIEDFPGMYEAEVIITEQTKDDQPRLKISEIGHQFLKFISDPTNGRA
jgi:hypothetical protein